MAREVACTRCNEMFETKRVFADDRPRYCPACRAFKTQEYQREYQRDYRLGRIDVRQSKKVRGQMGQVDMASQDVMASYLDKLAVNALIRCYQDAMGLNPVAGDEATPWMHDDAREWWVTYAQDWVHSLGVDVELPKMEINEVKNDFDF